MLEHESDGTEEALLSEQLSDEELRELLRRMGDLEFGGGEGARILDIVEATGKDPKAIGRLLAEIRKESFEEKYGLMIQEHEVRIEHLEEKVDRPIILPERSVLVNEFDTEDINELQQIAEERRRTRETSAFLVPILIVVFIIAFLFIVILASGGSGRQSEQSRVEIGQDVNGVHVSGPVGGPYTADDHGVKRPATKEETEEMATAEIIYLSHKQKEQERK